MVMIRKRSRPRCRCRYCGKRKTLSMQPGDYIRPQRCGCGRERTLIRKADELGLFRPQTWRVDQYRTDGREQRGKTCNCMGYSHPHFRARGFCDDNPNITTDDLQARYESGSWS